MPLGRKVDGGSNYKCSNFEDRERRLERITMNITLGPCVKVPNENRKISMISLGYPLQIQNIVKTWLQTNFIFAWLVLPRLVHVSPRTMITDSYDYTTWLSSRHSFIEQQRIEKTLSLQDDQYRIPIDVKRKESFETPTNASANQHHRTPHHCTTPTLTRCPI
jgi:hypothetical protein